MRTGVRPVIASEANQSSLSAQKLDCFVAEFIIGPAKGRTRWLLAMTVVVMAACASPAHAQDASTLKKEMILQGIVE